MRARVPGWTRDLDEECGRVRAGAAFRALRDAASWFDDVRTWQGRTYRLRSCRWGDDVIWGATSRIVQNFLAAIPPELL